MSFQAHTAPRRSAALTLTSLASALILAFPAVAKVPVDQNPGIDLSMPAPNVILMLDNSGSMNRNTMPDEVLFQLNSVTIGEKEGTKQTRGRKIWKPSLLAFSEFHERFPWLSKYLSRWQAHALEGRLWFDVDPQTADKKHDGSPAFKVENDGGFLIANLIAYNPLLTYPAPATGKLLADGSPERMPVDTTAVDGMHFYVLRSNDTTYNESKLTPGKISNYARYTIKGNSISAAKVTGFTPRDDLSAYGWLQDEDGRGYFYVDFSTSGAPHYKTLTHEEGGAFDLKPTSKFVFSNTAPKTDGSDINDFWPRQQEYLWGVINEDNAEQVSAAASRSTLKWQSYDGTRVVERTAAQEVENFANWRKYYHTRDTAVRAGIAEALIDVPQEIRLGLSTINQEGPEYPNVSTLWGSAPIYSNSQKRPGILHPIRTAQDRGNFTPANRADWYKNLWDLPRPSGGTPLHNALEQAGEYYSTEDAYGPHNTKGKLPSCRRNYTILATDGYWNIPENYRNHDGEKGKTIIGEDRNNNNKEIDYTYKPEAPYRDSHAATLADVAMKYWKNDLLPSHTNDVQMTVRDPAFWQHMTTYALSVGLNGSLNRETDWPGLKDGSVLWPEPAAENAGSYNIDDLWHAAVNSRGDFYVANDHESLAASLKQALEEITSVDGQGAAGTLDKNTINTQSDDNSDSNNIDPDGPQKPKNSKDEKTYATTAYWSEYHSAGWSGDLVATKRNIFGGNIKKTGDPTKDADPKTYTLWRASKVIQDKKTKKNKWEDRNILFNNNGKLSPFTWKNLPERYKKLLGVTTPVGSDPKSAAQKTVDYIRGQADFEDHAVPGEHNVKWRNRNGTIFGDFVNSQPVWVGEPPEIRHDRDAKDYDSFRDSHKNRRALVYIGGNDGMLHAFDAKTGKEDFAFMPQSVFNEELKNYTRSTYLHHYFVDGELTVHPVRISGRWETVLYGSLARGGDKGRNSIFALKITDPSKDPELLWEKTVTDLGGKLGQSIGKARMTQIAEDQWKLIIPLGPNSGAKGDQDGSRIAMVDIATGASTLVLDENGPGVIGVHTLDTDEEGQPGYGYTDTLYAGDLDGKLYRITGIDGTPSTSVVFETPNKQPISAAPTSVKIKGQSDPKKRVILFGTGKNLASKDQQDKNTQTWYGVYDENNNQPIKDDDLIARTYTIGTATFDGEEQEMPMMNLLTKNDMKGKKGWKMALNQDADAGLSAKMLLQNEVMNKYVVGWANYYDSSADNCDTPVFGRSFTLDPFLGSVMKSPTDMNDDGEFDEKDIQENGKVVVGFETDTHTAGQPPILYVDGVARIVSKGGTRRPDLDNRTGGMPSGYTWREIISTN